MGLWKGVAPRKRNRAVLYTIAWLAFAGFAFYVNIY